MLKTDPQTCIYIDDQTRNLREPKMMGMKTIVIDDEPNEWVDSKVDNILEVGEVIQKFLLES